MTSSNVVKNLEVDVGVDALQLLGAARNNLIENVRIRHTEGGLGFGAIGADFNTFRRCIAENTCSPAS